MPISKTCFLVVGLSFLLACPVQTHAADISWANGAGGLFSDSANWDLAQVPLSGDNAVFRLNTGPAGYTVTFDGNETNSQLILGNGVVSLDLNGFTYTLDEHFGVRTSVIVGEFFSDVAHLNITDGTLDSQNATIGETGTGTITVHGFSSMWMNSLSMRLGDFRGSGTLNITGGGAASNFNDTFIGFDSESTGAVTVDGFGSTWTNGFDLNVGYSGNGTLNITDGGSVTSGWVYVGQHSSSTGVVTVDGSGSTLAPSFDLYVGVEGTGTLNIIGGSVNVGRDTFVASGTGASGKIVFDNGTLTTGGLLAAFDDLTGMGRVNTNGLVSDIDLVFDATTPGFFRTFVINERPDQNVTVRLDIDGTGTMGAGYRGSGTMSISDGVVVESTNGTIGYASGSTGIVTVNGFRSMWTNGLLDVGKFGTGTLNITSGGAVTTRAAASVGDESGSTGTVTVDGVGSTLNSFRLNVGTFGSGTLNITSGGAVSSNTGTIGFSSNGVVTVDGPGSTWTNSVDAAIREGRFYVGGFGNGTLNIIGGGAVSNSFAGYVGDEPGSTGIVTVDGSASTWTNDTLTVGNAGNGTLNIMGGGAVINDVGIIGSGRFGNSGSGIVTVDSSGSIWTNSAELYVGQQGHGTLNITNGGAVNSSVGTISSGSDSTGVVTVDGLGSNWTNSSDLTVGDFGNGALHITAEGMVASTNGYIANSSSATGNVTISGTGSRWTLSDSLQIGGGEFIGGQGRLTLDGGTAEAAHSVSIRQTGRVQGTGTIVGNVINAGLVAPGFSPGIITIDGNYTQEADGVLEIEVGGLDNSDPMNPQFDQLIVSGTATLGGTTEFPLINGFVPQLDDEITYITAANVIGTPDALLAPNLAQVNPDLAFQVIANPTDVRLRFVEPGEVKFVDNSNGAVDAMDWHQPENWEPENGGSNRVPQSSDVVDLDRTQTGNVQRVEVKNGDAFTHEFTLQDQSSPIEVGVTNGHTLSSAVGDLTIGNNATVELDDGTIATAQSVHVLGTGMLTGTGKVMGDVMSESMVSPGSSTDRTGNIDVFGNYRQMATATLEIDLEGSGTGQFDTVAVSGEAELGGTLTVDVSQLGVVPLGTTVTILTANEGIAAGSEFDQYRVDGFDPASDDAWFAVEYDEGTAQLSAVNIYDVNNDDYLDGGDVTAFALALIDWVTFEEQYRYNPADRLDFSGSDSIDFDDIAPFRENHPYASGQAIAAAINELLARRAVPEPSAGSLGLLVVGVLVTVRWSERKQSYHESLHSKETPINCWSGR